MGFVTIGIVTKKGSRWQNPTQPIGYSISVQPIADRNLVDNEYVCLNEPEAAAVDHWTSRGYGVFISNNGLVPRIVESIAQRARRNNEVTMQMG